MVFSRCKLFLQISILLHEETCVEPIGRSDIQANFWRREGDFDGANQCRNAAGASGCEY